MHNFSFQHESVGRTFILQAFLICPHGLVYVYMSVRYESLTKVIELQNESKMRDEPIFYEEKSKEIIQLISTEGEVITVVSSKELDLLKKESRILPYCK